MTSGRAIGLFLGVYLMVLPICVPCSTAGGLFTETHPHYYQRHAEGWFWYQDPPPPVAQTAGPDAKTEAKLPPAPIDPLADPVAALEALQARIEQAKALAILVPTTEHVAQYLRLNQEVMARSSAFANTWQRVVWTTPALDSSLQHPVNDHAARAFNDERLAGEGDVLRTLARRHGLWFFFRGGCPFCHEFAPVLKQFAGTYGFQVIPVSLDGAALPEFPYPKRGVEAGLNLQVDTVPAVFLVNPRTRDIHPVAYGFVSLPELRKRIYSLLGHDGQNPPFESAATPGGPS
nr:conjugal transfer protein TraF [Gammaproteobacteria bacterium]